MSRQSSEEDQARFRFDAELRELLQRHHGEFVATFRNMASWPTEGRDKFLQELSEEYVDFVGSVTNMEVRATVEKLIAEALRSREAAARRRR